MKEIAVSEIARDFIAHRSIEAQDVLRLLDATIAAAAKTPAFHHPLGFIHVKIFADDANAVRLHIWPLQREQPTETGWPIHDHVFSLASYILHGSLVNRQYVVTPVNAEATYRIYEVRYQGAQ